MKVKGGCQSGRKVVTHNSKSDLPQAFAESFYFPSFCRKKITPEFFEQKHENKAHRWPRFDWNLPVYG